MTNPIEKHIADSLERFDKEFELRKIIGDRTFKDYCEYLYPDLKDFFKTEQLQLLSIARGEVEKKKNTAILGTEESSQAYKHKTDGYHRAIKDVLDLLTIKEND